MADGKFKNTTIVPLWKSQYGGFCSNKISAEAFDALQTVEEGGLFVIKVLKDESRKDPEKSPHAYLEFVPKSALGSKGAAPKRREVAKKEDEI